jgi:hypothetical protein
MNTKEWIDEGKKVLQSMRELAKGFPGKTVAEAYIASRKQYYTDLEKYLPALHKAVFSKRYILPNYRQTDYVKQEACDYLFLDSFFGYLTTDIPVTDHVSAHCINNFINSLHYNRPTFYLERELGEPLVRAPLPLDYYASDINWRFPAFRVYLPRNLVTITRDGMPSNVMFLDMTHIHKGKGLDVPKDITNDLNLRLSRSYYQGKIPLIDSEVEGLSVSWVLDFDSPLSVIAYAASTRLEETSIREIIKQSHDRLATPFESDELDTTFSNKVLSLAINILLFLSSIPVEYEAETVIRKPKTEGKRLIPGLYPARFIGQSQQRPSSKQPAHVASIPTGKHLPAHWRAGHWKRQPWGPKQSERKLIFVLTYHVGEKEEEKPNE